MNIKKVFLAFIFIFLASSLTKGIIIYTDRYRIYKTYKEKNLKLKKKKIELQTRLKKAESIDYIEKNLRNNLNLTKPGETLVILSYPTPTITIPTPTPKPISLQWLEIFK